MKRNLLRKRLRRLERSTPELEGDPLPSDVARAAMDAGAAVATRTGIWAEERGSFVERTVDLIVKERLAEIAAGTVTPWVTLMAFDGNNAEELSTDPAAVASLNRILVAVGFDPSTPPKPRPESSRRRLEPNPF
jgi:hypothetical protein